MMCASCPTAWRISASKTQVLKQPLRGCEADNAILNLDRKLIEEVTQFKYVGSNIRYDNTLASEVPPRIANAAANFGRLSDHVWKSHDLKLETGITVYKALILLVLLYGGKTWCPTNQTLRNTHITHFLFTLS